MPAKRDLAKDFIGKSSERRLNDPALRNAEPTAQAARKRATEEFGANDPKLKVALARVDQIVSDQLNRGHMFSTPKVVTKIIDTPKPDNKPRFHRRGVCEPLCPPTTQAVVGGVIRRSLACHGFAAGLRPNHDQSDRLPG